MTPPRLPIAIAALLAGAVGHADGHAPSQATYPNATVTSAPATTKPPQCDSNCTLISGLFVEVLRYTQREFDHTIKAADITLVINNRTNTTRTITNLIALPTGYTRPVVDDDGTAIWTVTTDYENNGTTVLTFPTEYTLYASSYGWEGTLVTTTADNAPAACETATDWSILTLPSHPQPGPITFPPDIQTYTRSPLNITFPPEGDKKGMYYTTSWDQIRESNFYQSVFPGEAAFSTCSWPRLPLPAVAQVTAYLLTETHVSYEDSTPTQAEEGGGKGGPNTSNVPLLVHTEIPVPIDSTTGPNRGPPPTADDTKTDGGLAPTRGQGGSGSTPTSATQAGGGGGSNDGSSGNEGDGNHGNGGTTPQAQPANSPTSGPTITAVSGSGGSQATMTVGGVTVSTDSGGHVMVSGTTLTPGSTVFVTPSPGGSPVPVAVQTGGGSRSGSGSGQGNSGSSGSSGNGGGSSGNGDSGDGGSGNSGGQGFGSDTGDGSGGNTVLVVGGSTTTLSPSTGSSSGAEGNPLPIVVAGSTYYPTATSPGASSSNYIISGKTLAPGHPVTLGGGASTTVVALTTDAGGNDVLVVGGSTSTLAATGDVGGFIISGLSGPVASSISSAEAASGSATITEAVLTLTSGGSPGSLTAVEIAPGTWVMPGEDGGEPRTISVGGEPVTLTDGEILSAASSGIVVGGGGTSSTVSASTTVVTGNAGAGGGQESPGSASRMVPRHAWTILAAVMASLVRCL